MMTGERRSGGRSMTSQSLNPEYSIVSLTEKRLGNMKRSVSKIAEHAWSVVRDKKKVKKVSVNNIDKDFSNSAGDNR